MIVQLKTNLKVSKDEFYQKGIYREPIPQPIQDEMEKRPELVEIINFEDGEQKQPRLKKGLKEEEDE